MSRLPPFLIPTLSLVAILLLTFWTTSLLLSVPSPPVPSKTPHHNSNLETLTHRRTPPQPPPAFPPPPSTIHAAIASSSGLLSRLSTLTPQDATFNTVLSPLAASEAVLTTLINTLTILSLVSPSDTTASLLATLNNHTLTASTNPSLPPLLTALIPYNSTHSIDTESTRYLTSWYTATLHDGLTLPLVQQQRLQVLLGDMEVLRGTFQANLISINATLSLSRSELSGVPAEFLSTLAPDPEIQVDGEQMLVLPLKPAAVTTVLSSALNPTTRRKVFIANENRCPANGPVFADLITLRAEVARLLGYESWAEFRVEGRMVPDVGFVGSFLEEVREGVWSVAEQEVAERQQAKEQDEAQRGDQLGEVEEGYHLWDKKYVDHLLHSQPGGELSFKLESTLPKVLGIMGNVFGLEFVRVSKKDWEEMLGVFSTKSAWDELRSADEIVQEEVHKSAWDELRSADEVVQEKGHESAWDEVRNGDEIGGADEERKMAWHESVQLYAVWNLDKQDSGEGGKFVGYLYLDLLARTGKTAQAGNLNVSPGYDLPLRRGGTSPASSTDDPQARRHYPSTAVLTDFPSSGVLSHAELVVLFHELGHAVHDLSSETKYARYHGPAGVPVDFAEVPSRVGEEFAWDVDVLHELGADRESANTLVKARFDGAALSTLRGVHIASFDMAVHSSSHIEDVGNLYNQLRKEIIPVLGAEEKMDGYATFGHLEMGYDAGYYGYLLSSCYAADVWEVFQQADQAGKDGGWQGKERRWGGAGRRWRKIVLEAGGTQGGMELLRAFLGRSAGCAEFYRRLGAKVE